MPIEQDFENLPPAAEKSSFYKKRLIAFVSFFGTVLILLLAVAVFTSFSQKENETMSLEEPTPTETTEFREELTSPSLYATDSALLKIEEEVKKLEEKIQGTDLKEAYLTPPLLEMGIDFKE